MPSHSSKLVATNHFPLCHRRAFSCPTSRLYSSEAACPPITGARSRCQKHKFGPQAVEDAHHRVSHAVDDDPKNKSHPQQKKHTAFNQSLVVFLFLYFLVFDHLVNRSVSYVLCAFVNALVHVFHNECLPTPHPRCQSEHWPPQLPLPWPYKSSMAQQFYLL